MSSDRYEGTEGRRRLVDALSSQTIVNGNLEIATALADKAVLEDFVEGTVLIEQGACDQRLVFLLSGSVTININGREVVRRTAGQHVGEMAVIDPAANRSATVLARNDTSAAILDEPEFAEIASKHPDLWRRIACELADRLRQRNAYVVPRNDIPRVFIGSSTEAAPVAAELQLQLSKTPGIEVTTWTDDVFAVGAFAIEDLERVAAESDFAVLVCAPDDTVVSRRKRKSAPRDNVIFELGLFMGASSRKRVFILEDQGAAVKLPSDLVGVNTLRYERPARGKPKLTTAVKALTKAIQKEGPK